jgi:hypothetical protein
MLVAMTFGAVLLLAPLLQGQENGTGAPSLTARDRADMQQLVADYARALGTCAAREYAALFVEPDGFFASGPRGKVQGQKKLIGQVGRTSETDRVFGRNRGLRP